VGPFRGLVAALMASTGRINKFWKVRRYAQMMHVPLSDYYYSRTSSPFTRFNSLKAALYSEEFARTVGMGGANRPSQRFFAAVEDQSLLDQMLFVDTKTWLPDDLLIKADRTTMAASLELRVPFLDHEVLEFAATLPPEYKVKDFETKRVLKRAFHGRVPNVILRRKKAGFPVPFGKWLDRELREYVADTLLSQRAVSRGYFQKREVERLLFDEGNAGKNSAEKFSLLILELWHRRFIDGAI
jgi:asparagine synthase (glutamine-hydrolysing)